MQEYFENLLLNHPLLKQVLQRWEQIGLPDAWLVAGSVAQTVWNERHGFAPEFGLKDIDLVYFDQDDLSEKREKERLKFIEDLFSDLQVEFDVRNQARVHLWYEEKFGKKIEQYESLEDAINSWPTTATALGVRKDDEGNFRIYAPFGLNDLFTMTVRANKTMVTREVYEAKAAKWTKKWDLQVIPWEDA